MRASERATQYVVTLLGAVAALPEELNLDDGREGRTDDGDGGEGEGEGEGEEEALTAALSNSHNIAAAAMTRTEQRGGRRFGSAGTRWRRLRGISLGSMSSSGDFQFQRFIVIGGRERRRGSCTDGRTG